MAGEGSEGAADKQLAAARVEAPKEWSLQTQPSGFPEKSNCTDCLKPEARTADSSAITLLIR